MRRRPNNQRHIIGVDLGGTKILAGVFDQSGKVLARHKQPTLAAEGPKAVIARVVNAVLVALETAAVDLHAIEALGIGAPGQVHSVRGVVYFAPNLQWKNVALRQQLERRLSIPIFLENDVNLGTFGEFICGAARDAKNVVGLFVGTGVGGALIIDGEIYNGFNRSAGELGHTIIDVKRARSVEDLAGRRAMAQEIARCVEAGEKTVLVKWLDADLSQLTSKHLVKALRRGDRLVHHLVNRCSEAVGVCVANAINAFSPEVVVLGGGTVEALGRDFLAKVKQTAKRYALPHAIKRVRIVSGRLGDDAGIIGAAHYARLRLSRRS